MTTAAEFRNYNSTLDDLSPEQRVLELNSRRNSSDFFKFLSKSAIVALFYFISHDFDQAQVQERW